MHGARWQISRLIWHSSHRRFDDFEGQGAFKCVPRSQGAALSVYVLTYYYTLLMLMGDDVGPTNAAETVTTVSAWNSMSLDQP